MLKITSDGDLSFVSKSLRIFSDSSERDFMFIFCANDDYGVLFNLRNEGMFVVEKYCCLELNVKFLRDFHFDFNFAGFYVEIMNVAHHEEF